MRPFPGHQPPSKKDSWGLPVRALKAGGKAAFLLGIGLLGAVVPGRLTAAEPMMDTSALTEFRGGSLNAANQGRFDQALKSEQTALRIAQDQYGPTSLSLVPILNDVAVLQWLLAEYRDAEESLKWGLALVEKNLGPDDPQVAGSLDLLAGLYGDEGRLLEAEGLEKRALVLRQALRPADPLALARTQDQLGQVELGLKNQPQALELFLEAQKNHGKAGQPDPDFSIHLWKHLALAYSAGMDSAQAQSCLEKALETAEKNLKPGTPGRTGALEDLADFYLAQDQPDKAKPLWESALASAGPRVGGECDVLTIPYFKGLARAEEALGDRSKARELWLKILQADRTAFGGRHPRVALDLMALAGLERKLGREGKAREDLKESLSILKDLFSKDHPLVLEAVSL